MQLGVTLPNDVLSADGPSVLTFLAECQRVGYDYVVALDHVLGADAAKRPDWTGFYNSDNAFHEPLVLLGAAAAAAPGLGLATGVVILPQRQTALLAKQVAELDVLSGGRVRLGVGVGWNQVEYQALGEDFSNRGDRYEEQIQLLRALWTTSSLTFDGRFHTVDRAGINPLPVQRPIPIWMGGGTATRVLERIGRMADGWIVMGGVQRPDAETHRALRVVQEAARAAGRVVADLGLEGRVPLRNGLVAPDEMGRDVYAWRGLGATHLSLHGLPPNRSLEEYVELASGAYALLTR